MAEYDLQHDRFAVMQPMGQPRIEGARHLRDRVVIERNSGRSGDDVSCAAESWAGGAASSGHDDARDKVAEQSPRLVNASRRSTDEVHDPGLGGNGFEHESVRDLI